jgi:hypothetical protein
MSKWGRESAAPSSIDVVTLFGSVVIEVAVSYPAYWAFAIRRALAVGLYRRQALGIGLVSILGVLNFVLQTLLFAYDQQLTLAGAPTPLGDSIVAATVAWKLCCSTGWMLPFWQLGELTPSCGILSAGEDSGMPFGR